MLLMLTWEHVISVKPLVNANKAGDLYFASHLDANTKIAAEIQITSQQKHLLKMINIYKYKHNT